METSFLVLLFTVAISAQEWTPQLGTIKYPKIPELSPRARKGSFYLIQDEYYRLIQELDVLADPDVFEVLPQSGYTNNIWQHIPRGSYLVPKIFGADDKCEEGDLFLNAESGRYYRAQQRGHVLGEWRIDIIDWRRSVCQWEYVDDKENWMSLLRPIIGDQPLGDIVIPGSHDAGTWGINEYSILVDQNFLFQLADELTPETVANWSLTHDDKFDLMLSSGFRYLDMRPADVDEIEPGVFRWWHGMTSDDITEGLQHVGQFSRDHPEEILVLDMQHFAAPGNLVNPTEEITPARKDILSDMILQHLGDRMVPRGNLPSNPTMNEVLATGRSIITVMKDDYIKAKDDRYWDNIIHSAWVGTANPEDLFNERSQKLQEYRLIHANELTDISGACTPDEKVVVAGLISVYGDNETIRDILEDILPQILDIYPANMSYEGLWLDLLSMARYGTNTEGMRARDPEDYTNGASVHYSGTNDMLRHWLARPDQFKPNIIYVDDFLTSTAVTTAIEYNEGLIPREVAVAHQGNPMNGYYVWDETDWATEGGDAGLYCVAVDMRYTIVNLGSTLDSGVLSQMGLLELQEGQWPPGATIEIDVSSVGGLWRPLWSDNIQQMINTNNDVYIRGTDMGIAGGFAYISTAYNDFGIGCNVAPIDQSNFLAYIEW